MTMASPKAKSDALPVRFSWNACPLHASVYPAGSASEATRSTAWIACPELTPGLPEPRTFAARKPLKRSTCSAPTMLSMRTSAFSGIISPVVVERTKIAPIWSGFARNGASDCTCTR